MFQYFSKTEDQCSQAMKKAAKEALENNMHKYETKEIIAKAIISALFKRQFIIFCQN